MLTHEELYILILVLVITGITAVGIFEKSFKLSLQLTATAIPFMSIFGYFVFT